jgi:hypothetical protein
MVTSMPIVRFITNIFPAVVMLGTPHCRNCSHGDVQGDPAKAKSERYI